MNLRTSADPLETKTKDTKEVRLSIPLIFDQWVVSDRSPNWFWTLWCWHYYSQPQYAQEEQHLGTLWVSNILHIDLSHAVEQDKEKLQIPFSSKFHYFTFCCLVIQLMPFYYSTPLQDKQQSSLGLFLFGASLWGEWAFSFNAFEEKQNPWLGREGLLSVLFQAHTTFKHQMTAQRP